MAVPYTFAGATSSIPLSQLDTNFASTITLGNTAIQLGNTVTTLNNMTLANVTISSGNVTITNVTVTTANVTVGNITTLTGTSATYTNIASGNVTITGGTLNNVAIGGTTAASGAFTTLSASGAFSLTGDQVQISEGGTGQTTANAAFNALAPSQTGNSGKYLKTDGTDTSWDAIDINTADITGTLPILNGGTGQTTANAAFNALAPSQTSQSGKYLKTDGTNASWDALDISTADITGTLPIANGGTGLTALGTGVQTALGQNVTGSGGIVLATSPVLTTPNLGTPSAVTLTNATGLPISTGVSGLGTNVATALAVNVGTAGAFVVNGGALGTPSGGTLTNCTGYPTSALSGSINLATQVTGTLATTNGGTGLSSFTANGVVYASSSSALTTGSALTFDGTNLANTLSVNASAGIRVTNSNAGTATSTNTSYSNGTNAHEFGILGTGYTTYGVLAAGDAYIYAGGSKNISLSADGGAIKFGAGAGGTEAMRLTSTSLYTASGINVGIGLSNPATKLDVYNSQASGISEIARFRWNNGGSGGAITWANQAGTVLGQIANTSDANGNPLEFWVYNNSTALTKYMTLSGSGNLGIGTSSPKIQEWRAGTYLTVANASTRGQVEIDGAVADSSSASLGALIFTYSTNTTNHKDVALIEATSSGATANQRGGVLNFYTKANGTASPALNMALDSSGNLGLGVTPSTILDIGANNSTAKTITLRYSTIPSYYSSTFDGSVGLNTLSLNTYNTSSGSASWSAFSNTSYGSAAIQLAAGTGTANSIRFLVGSAQNTNPTEVARIDSSGNLGLGVTPSAWGASIRSIDIGFGTSLTNANSTTDTWLSSNAYYTTQWLYKNTAPASYYQQASGAHRWYTAPSGTAGNTISFTQAMTLDASGNLVVGDTTANRAGASHGISVNGTSSSVLETNYASARAGNMYSYASGTNVGEVRNLPLVFTTNDTERARIPSTGGFVVGTAALATNATTGFLYVPTCAGTPTGTPATQTGTAPIVVDTTNNKLYFYSGGQWRDAGP